MFVNKDACCAFGVWTYKGWREKTVEHSFFFLLCLAFRHMSCGVAAPSRFFFSSFAASSEVSEVIG